MGTNQELYCIFYGANLGGLLMRMASYSWVVNVTLGCRHCGIQKRPRARCSPSRVEKASWRPQREPFQGGIAERWVRGQGWTTREAIGRVPNKRSGIAGIFIAKWESEPQNGVFFCCMMSLEICCWGSGWDSNNRWNEKSTFYKLNAEELSHLLWDYVAPGLWI